MINNRYLDFLIEHELTSIEFLILWCSYQGEYIKLKKLLEKDVSYKKNILELLYNRKLIETYDMSDVHSIYPTEKFTKLFLSDIEEAANEIWELWYPKVKVNVNGKLYSSKGIDYDEFVIKYRNITRGVVKRHLEIKNITKNYVEDNPSCLMSLNKYIGTRLFDDMADEYSESKGTNDPFMKTI